MTLEYIQPDGLNDPRQFYTHVVSGPASRVVFISGQYGADDEGRIVDGGYDAQVAKAFENLRLAIEGAGLSATSVAKVTHLIVAHDESKLAAVRSEMDDLFGDRKPASTLIGVERLARDGMLYEVEAYAILS